MVCCKIICCPVKPLLQGFSAFYFEIFFMKIYRISHRDKTWKDKKNITLYHISPDNFTRFSPKSSFRGLYKGVYFSPSYRSLIRDWSYYVRDKKTERHTLHQIQNELIKEKNKLTEKVRDNTATEEEKITLEQLDNKIDKLYESMGKKTFQENQVGYKTLYLYTVVCPMETYKEIQDIFNSVQKAEEKRAEEKGLEPNFAFWAWGEQVFVPDYLLDQIKIVSVKKIDASKDLGQERTQVERKPRFITDSEENKKTWFGNSEEYERKRKEKEAKELERQQRELRREKVRNMAINNPEPHPFN